MHETLAVIVITGLATLLPIGGIEAGMAMLCWPISPLDPELPPARANGLPALPGQSGLARVTMTLLGIGTILVGLMAALAAVVAALIGLIGLPGPGKLVLVAAITGGLVIAHLVHARRNRQPA